MLGAITPTTVNGVAISGSSTPTLAVTGTSTISGVNTGDQTNISGNAATVTTNANLTGPITSSGNATSVASQTGTGSTFVMNTSPTLVTPNIGVATGTGLTLTGTSAAIVSVGANGATNPVLNIDASTASVVTGLNIKGQVSGNGIRLSALSSASNENFYIDGKGTGSVYINTIGTGYVEIGNQTAIVSTNSLAFAVSQALFAGKPAFSVDTSVASGATGLVVKAATTGNGVSLTATDSGSNTGMSIDAKGTGGITLNGTATGGITLNGTATGGITLARTTTHSDGTDIVFGTGTGTKIGTATNQRLAFYNSTPAVQPSTTGTTTGFTAGAGSAVDSAATFTGNMGSAAYTIGDIVKALKTLGLLAA